ncbi:hypothetical protein FGG08_007714 [Glutinoglossum americanum]|uniref:Uncharacterized protein n=1 Tax=Glutinoglossum americanum TaxID=1670608 RepID=A0A9P8I2Q8_9PEZI|nr:hypothetical protein FGG08_007714 [Glutinoglossum americanum]
MSNAAAFNGSSALGQAHPGDASLALDPESDDLLPYPVAICPAELDQFIRPAGPGRGRRPGETRG